MSHGNRCLRERGVKGGKQKTQTLTLFFHILQAMAKPQSRESVLLNECARYDSN